jgi:large subunit ribosomal protein L22
MGVRKKLRAEKIKEQRKNTAFAVLRNNPTSPRKMRLVADMVRGMAVDKALYVLKYTPKEAARKMEKLLESAISNWEQKSEETFDVNSNLFISEVRVDGGRMLKRLRPAPQGRAHRIRKRSNHVTLVIDTKNKA